jgi:phenylpyruvate tautomerase PptA (4-oxalocrotonate tautomerase family)
MPHIRIRAISETTVEKLSAELPQDLAPLMQTSTENFTVEKVATQFYKDGARTEGDPMIEVLWFERGQEVKNQCAKKITEIVRKHLNAEYIAVVFTALPKESYFENGEHF